VAVAQLVRARVLLAAGSHVGRVVIDVTVSFVGRLLDAVTRQRATDPLAQL